MSDTNDEDDMDPSEATSLASLTDGRKELEYWTLYPWNAWIQIALELIYLMSILLVSLVFLFNVGYSVNKSTETYLLVWSMGFYPENKELLVWVVMGLAALCGGAASSLKWLYHTVAKKRWHRDRIVWRLVVPVLSSVLSVFTGMMVSTGLLPPIFSQTAFESLLFCSGFGFFLGFFSDNLLAWLQNKAYKIFGVVDERED